MSSEEAVDWGHTIVYRGKTIVEITEESFDAGMAKAFEMMDPEQLRIAEERFGLKRRNELAALVNALRTTAQHQEHVLSELLRVIRAEQPPEDLMVVDPVRGAHSRACGISMHFHGPACHTNCPTCQGKTMGGPLTDVTIPAQQVAQVQGLANALKAANKYLDPDVARTLARVAVNHFSIYGFLPDPKVREEIRGRIPERTGGGLLGPVDTVHIPGPTPTFPLKDGH